MFFGTVQRYHVKLHFILRKENNQIDQFFHNCKCLRLWKHSAGISLLLEILSPQRSSPARRHIPHLNKHEEFITMGSVTAIAPFNFVSENRK